jgi:hypothetical protein
MAMRVWRDIFPTGSDQTFRFDLLGNLYKVRYLRIWCDPSWGRTARCFGEG